MALTDEIYDEEYGEESVEAVPDMQKVTKKNNILTIHGNAHSMNLNALVLENVVQSQYYKNHLAELTMFQQIVDEAFYNVRHLEPWERGTRKTQGMTGMCGGVRGVGAGGIVSTAFCLLYKFHTIKLTRKQLISLINNRQSPYIRGLGFMYIRYTQPPADLWYWLEPYFEDEDQIDPRSGGGDLMSFGNMVRLMLTKLDWYGTLFPRIPVPIQKQIEENFAEKRRQMMEQEGLLPPDRDRDRHRDSRGRSHDRERDSRKRTTEDKEKSEPVVPAKKLKPRCGHHLRHHHCRKHRKECPAKAKEARAKREREEAEKEMAETLRESEATKSKKGESESTPENNDGDSCTTNGKSEENTLREDTATTE